MKLNPARANPDHSPDSSFYRPFTADFHCRRSLRGYPLKVVAYFGITVDVSVEGHRSVATRGACKQSSYVQHLVPDSYSTQCTVRAWRFDCCQQTQQLSIGSEFFSQQPLLSASRLQDIGSLAEQASKLARGSEPGARLFPSHQNYGYDSKPVAFPCCLDISRRVGGQQQAFGDQRLGDGFDFSDIGLAIAVVFFE